MIAGSFGLCDAFNEDGNSSRDVMHIEIKGNGSDAFEFANDKRAQKIDV